jgi:hypothetical protein
MGGFLGKVVRSFEIPAEEPDLAVYISFEQRCPVRPGELAMNGDRRSARDGCHLSSPLAAGFEARTVL